ncbi:MAG: molybdopterin molybdotransferase MoeA [Acidobacteria bacterium]|nr:molybdopterin molybdotransferase MoeA [Acidobacteriota bacterium]
MPWLQPLRRTVAVLTFTQARETVIAQIRSAGGTPASERLPLLDSQGRVLAEPIHADRDFPPFPRSTRDGFAVRAQDVSQLPMRLRCKGQVKAGSAFSGSIAETECVEIMTGAPVPEGADAVVMVEYTERDGDAVEVNRAVSPGENVVARGSEARSGDLLIEPGRRIRYGEVALMASVGRSSVSVCRQPRVAIIPTGDEVVEVEQTPGPFQIRNSNGYSLYAQVKAEHCTPVPLGVALDREDRLAEMIAEGLKSDLLLLSGGVSMGKYDLVEKVLAEFGAEFFFDGVLIQPGRPLVFGRAHGTFFFGLPGNPLSTMVTFELFVRPALALLSGEASAPLRFLRARLARDFRRKPGLASFLPALLEGDYYDPSVSVVEWKGSGDIASLNRANCYLAVPEEAAEIKAGEWVSVLTR